MVDYNNTLAAFHFAKGTLLDYSQIHVLEGPAPAVRPVRAVEHEQKRAQELAQRVSTKPIPEAPLAAAGPRFPEFPPREAVALPALIGTDTKAPTSVRPVALLQPAGATEAKAAATPAVLHPPVSIDARHVVAPGPPSHQQGAPRAALGLPKGT